MDLYKRVLSYFKFSKGPKFIIFGKKKTGMYISRKLNTEDLIIWAQICFAFIIMKICIDFNNNNINIHLTLKNSSINFEAAPLLELIFGIIAILIVALIIKNKSKTVFKKLEPKKTDLNYYIRELPSQLRPAHVRMLTHDGLIDDCSIAATILDLIDRKYLELTKSTKKEFLFNNTEIFVKKSNKDTNDLLLYEQYLIDWITKSSKNVKNMSQKFGEFEALLILSFPLNTYYQKNDKCIESNIMSAFYLLIALLTMISGGLLSILSLYISFYFVGKILLITPRHILKLEGINERDAWFDLKRFLLDFTEIKDKTPEMVILWNYYLSYSIALDVDSIASKEIKNFFEKNIFRISTDTEDNTSSMQMRLDWHYVISRVKEIINQEATKYNNK
jgi:uncharacterized membrane protein